MDTCQELRSRGASRTGTLTSPTPSCPHPLRNPRVLIGTYQAPPTEGLGLTRVHPLHVSRHTNPPHLAYESPATPIRRRDSHQGEWDATPLATQETCQIHKKRNQLSRNQVWFFTSSKCVKESFLHLFFSFFFRLQRFGCITKPGRLNSPRAAHKYGPGTNPYQPDTQPSSNNQPSDHERPPQITTT